MRFAKRGGQLREVCQDLCIVLGVELVGQFEGVDISEVELVGACYSHEAEPLAAS